MAFIHSILRQNILGDAYIHSILRQNFLRNASAHSAVRQNFLAGCLRSFSGKVKQFVTCLIVINNKKDFFLRNIFNPEHCGVVLLLCSG